MFEKAAERNLEKLKGNAYPGRGIIIGATPDGKRIAQIYWIMGRSENSRNRIFLNENGFVRTKAYDESKVTDPSLIIYYPVKYLENLHIVSNGDQTDTVYTYLSNGKTFEEALLTREFEPDAPNFTPRITGIVEIGEQASYKLSILKSQEGNPALCLRAYYVYNTPIAGYGHCIHTYETDANPLPSFCGEPYLLPLGNDMEETLHRYWDALNAENRISILAKYIDIQTGTSDIRIINKH